MSTRPRLRLGHIGIAVANLEEARKSYEKLLGVSASPVEEVPSEGVRVSFFELENCRLELLEATGDASPIRKFLDRHRAGVHHLSLELATCPGGGEIESLLASLRSKGVPLLDEAPRHGAEGSMVFFLHPRAAAGVLIEFSERSSSEKPTERSLKKEGDTSP